MISIILGSENDRSVADKAEAFLKEFGAEYETNVASAHRNPEKVKKLVEGSKADVFIAIAGLSAALPGVVASHTIKPVIGVPVEAKLDGLDALLSIVQMPKGVPVATVGIGNSENAAILALEILALKDAKVQKKLADYRKKWE